MNPLATYSIGLYGYALACSGRIAAARALLDDAVRDIPNVDSILSARSAVAVMAGDFEQALRDARRCAEFSPDVPNQLAALACAQAACGEDGHARRTLALMQQTRCRLAPAWHALTLAALGEDATAAAMLRHAAKARCTWLPIVRHDPRLRAVMAEVAVH